MNAGAEHEKSQLVLPVSASAAHERSQLAYGVDLVDSLEDKRIMEIPGDGWCLFHAIARCRSGPTESDECAVFQAQRCYLQALEFSWQMDDVDNVFVPDGEAETLKHARFLEKHGIRGDALNDNRLFLSSKVVAVLSGNEELDSYHHGTIVDLWALCKAFAFDVIIWRVPDNQYYSARSQKVLLSAEAAETLRRQPATVQLVHQDIGPPDEG